MRNKILTTAILVMLPFLLTACSLQELPLIGKFFGQGSVNNKQANLTIWGMWENSEVIEALIEKYKESHPNVTITYEDRSAVKAPTYKETVFGRIDQDNAPDIVLVHNSWVPFLKDKLAPADTQVLSADSFNETFYPAAIESAVLDNKVYAAPAYYDGLVLIYNKKHFAAINQQTPPTAWEEFRKLALTLTVRGEDMSLIRGGAAMGTAGNNDFFADIISLMFLQAGIRVPQDLTGRSAQDALSYYTIFSTEDRVWDSSFPEASAAFAQERVSMLFAPSWRILDIYIARPDFGSDVIGVAPVPQVDPQNPVTVGSFWMYAVPQRSSNTGAAWDFIKFLSDEEQALSTFSLASQYRPFGAPYARVSLKDQLSEGPSAPFLKPLIDTAPFGKTSVLVNRSGNDTYTEPLKFAVNALVDANNNPERLTPEQLLKKVKDAIEGRQ